MSQNTQLPREQLHRRIRTLPAPEIAMLGKRKRILSDALKAFNARLLTLPERERDATLTLLYEEITGTLFEFHRCLEYAAATEKAAKATSSDERVRLVREFQAHLEAFARLYELE